MRYQAAVIATLLATASAQADPHLEASGFFGVDDFGSKIRLGNSLAPEQRPQTAPMFGARLTAVVLRTPLFELGLEPELAFTASWTGYGFDGPRESYFAPVLGYRGSVILRSRAPRMLRFHVLAGGGGATVFTKSPYMSTDSDPVLYFGAGATLAVGDGWQLRADVRQGFMPGNAGSAVATYSGMVGIGVRFGSEPAPPHRRIEEPEDLQIVTGPLLPPKDPKEPPKDPEPPRIADRDGDGIADANDRCPDQAEDFDHFQDDDGCPDVDNDQDGILDAKDKCPDQPETINGFEDEDGCPDQLPAAVSAAFETATAVRFEAARARLTEAAKTSLAKALAQLRAHPTVHVVVTGHPDPQDHGDAAKAEALAKKRAEVVKWYLVEQGVPADQLETTVGQPKKAPIELRGAPPSPH